MQSVGKEPNKSRVASQQQHSNAVAQGRLLLRQRVAQALEIKGWGTVLVLADALLSIFSVVLYIVGTYFPNLTGVSYVQFSLACVFALNWLLWAWVAADRLMYLFSWTSAVDVVTILPELVLFGVATSSATSQTAETLPGLNFLRVLRMLRVLRLFRMKHVVRRHLEGVVTEAASKLGISLVCILLIAAGLYYELEKYGPPDHSRPDLNFHQGVYWAAVTITTVGYGDLVPTYWAPQLMLIGLLVLSFTVLPYFTSGLAEALTSTSKYQRKR